MGFLAERGMEWEVSLYMPLRAADRNSLPAFTAAKAMSGSPQCGSVPGHRRVCGG
jgi:hypothetical protein